MLRYQVPPLFHTIHLLGSSPNSCSKQPPYAHNPAQKLPSQPLNSSSLRISKENQEMCQENRWHSTYMPSSSMVAWSCQLLASWTPPPAGDLTHQPGAEQLPSSEGPQNTRTMDALRRQIGQCSLSIRERSHSRHKHRCMLPSCCRWKAKEGGHDALWFMGFIERDRG